MVKNKLIASEAALRWKLSLDLGPSQEPDDGTLGQMKFFFNVFQRQLHVENTRALTLYYQKPINPCRPQRSQDSLQYNTGNTISYNMYKVN